MARNRRVDLVALFTLSVLVLSVVLGLLSGDPRTLAIREGWTAALGGLFGLWMLVTVVVGKPAQLTLGRRAAGQRGGARRPRLHAADRPHLLVTTVEWFGSLACLITWHVWYMRKEHVDA